ncbi:MAG TPA: M20/M25/M40 family metallo-hydrolase [Candidatus Methanomethylicus sp.]|nr:M20/M25/M40 family metallo-hydrolase [Candidatus Methanomethylicus sp.]
MATQPRIEDNPIVKEFIELVTTYSASGDERKIADLLIRKLKEIGCVDIYEDDAGKHYGGNTGNIHATLPGTMPGSILFAAHMDRGEIMMVNGARPPIRPVINEKEGRIETDGTTLLAGDDIAGVVAILDALRRLKASGKPHANFEVLFSASEEDAAKGSLYADYSRIKSKIAYALDSNGAMGKISSGFPSGAKMSVELIGRGAHYGSAPERGINAATAAAKIMLNIKQGTIDENTESNFAVLHAGEEATYGICDYAVIKGQAQSQIHQHLLDYIEYFKRFCKVSMEYTGIQLKFWDKVYYYAYKTPDDAGSVRLASKVLTDMGKKPFTMNVKACYDSNNFVLHGIDSVALGMGYYFNHSKNEYMSLPQLLENGEFIKNIVLEYSNNRDLYEKKA